MIPKRAIYIFIGLLALVFLIAEFTKDDNPFPSVKPIQDAQLKEAFPQLLTAITARDASAIKHYTDYTNKEVRNLAWRALANTPVQDLGSFVDQVVESGNKLAWFALSLHELNDTQLNKLQDTWGDKPEQRSGIALVFGRQGKEHSLGFLMDQFDEAAGTEYEYEFALAVARLMRAHPLPVAQQKKVIERAFAVADPKTTRAYLYGYYRDRTRDPKLDSEIKSAMYQNWQSYGLGNNTEVDQFVVGLIPDQSLYQVTLYYNSEEELEGEVQLGVELSQALSDVDFDDQKQLAASILLHHGNPHVAQQAIVNLDGKFKEGNNLYRYLVNQLLPNPRTHPFVWIYALEAAASVDSSVIAEYHDRLERVGNENPYLMPKILEVWQIKESAKEYLNRLSGIIKKGQSLSSSYAILALTSYWNSKPDEARSAEIIRQVRDLVFTALKLKDRGVSFGAENILGDETLFTTSDFGTINNALSDFALPEDIEAYQAFGRLYKERFEEQGRSVIDSLAAKGYAPLNRSLADAGWDVEAPGEPEKVKLRMPNWNNFWKLGEEPVWVLETNRGIIKVQMNPLSAPATVSAIDSLTRAGAYNGVPFHRVVPNFVIQGGDIEREDGFGGPEFVIPTEGSEKEYVRGAAGIASAGTDTEGSQYFFMHQWKPHLNGLYTLFGNVTEGMDVVDEIVVGDSVQVAYWQ